TQRQRQNDRRDAPQGAWKGREPSRQAGCAAICSQHCACFSFFPVVSSSSTGHRASPAALLVPAVLQARPLASGATAALDGGNGRPLGPAPLLPPEFAPTADRPSRTREVCLTPSPNSKAKGRSRARPCGICTREAGGSTPLAAGVGRWSKRAASWPHCQL